MAERERDERTGKAAAAQRMQRKDEWVDQQIRVAMERGEFDDLPGAGKPIKDLGAQHDPNWWVKRLVEREKITGVLPPALQLRKDDAELDARLDRHTAESEVRREVGEFNARVMKARYTPVDGPPLVTMPRDIDVEVDAWRERRLARRREAAARKAATAPTAQAGPRRYVPSGRARPARHSGTVPRTGGRSRPHAVSDGATTPPGSPRRTRRTRGTRAPRRRRGTAHPPAASAGSARTPR